MSRARLSSWAGFLLLDTAPILAVGAVVYYLLCLHVADCYPVPSGSMEPTIHGDRVHGDIVLVDKTAWWFHPPQPWDTVVVRGLDGDSLMVKRVAYLSADRRAKLRIHDGDLWVADENGVFGDSPLVKDPVELADLRIPVFHFPDPPCEQSLEEFFHLPRGSTDPIPPAPLRIPPAAPALATVLQRLSSAARTPRPGEVAPRIEGLAVTNKAIDTSYLTPAGRREWEGINYYPDIGLELELQGPVPTLVFVLEYHQRDYALVYDPQAGTVQLVFRGAAAPPRPVPRPAPAGTFAFGFQDGYLFLVHSGAGRATRLFHERIVLDPNPDYRPGRPNGLHFGSVGGALVVRRLTVFHDLPVTSVGGRHGTGSGVYELESGHMFLLGDNAHDSSDSRGPLGAVSLGRLVGRPLAILAPASRARFFCR